MPGLFRRKGSSRHSGPARLGVWGTALAGLSGVVGAGFASGREAAVFFARYGAHAQAGVVVTGVIVTFVCWLVLDLAWRKGTHDYHSLIAYAVTPRGADAVDVVMLGLLLGTMAVMVAGAGEILSRAFPVKAWLGGAAFCVGAGLLLRGGSGGFATLSRTLFPFVLGSCLALSLTYIAGPRVGWTPRPVLGVLEVLGELGAPGEPGLPPALPVSAQAAGGGGVLPGNWALAALLYASYNTALFTSVFASLGEKVSSRRVSRGAAVVTTALFTGLLATVVQALRVWTGDAGAAPMPLMTLANSLSPVVAQLYGAILLLALFSATVANGYALASRISDWTGWPLAVAVSLGFAWAVGQFGFGQLVAVIYPVFGWLWLATLPGLAWEHWHHSGGGFPPQRGQGFRGKRQTDIGVRKVSGFIGGSRRW